jgi:type IV fimbrial biogenesis protein FimT
MRNQRGVTLVALLIVMVILGILVGVGVPALRDLVLSNRQAAAVNELITALQMARSHAVTRGEVWDVYNTGTNPNPTVAVCASDDGLNCAGAWQDGWIIFRDPDGNGQPDAVDGGVLRAFEGHDGLNIGSDGVTLVRFRRDGRIAAPADFTFCDSRGDSYARLLSIDFTGRPSVQKAPAGTCGG